MHDAVCLGIVAELQLAQRRHAGGSRSKGASVLARLHALAEAQAELEGHSAALQRAEAELQARARAADEHRRRACT